ncbi:MAG: hypothetical protein JXD23_08420 [Spirochaetales bacterium]|nr:hypothetical protein [Spirochaetales bacterium]
MRKYITRNIRLPKVLIPYPGPILTPGAQDVFLYLRPEVNGVLVESLLFRVFKSQTYAQKFTVVYLANMTGDFVVKNRIIEQHYALKIMFARFGKAAFTRAMQGKFEEKFGVPFREAKIVPSFGADRLLGMSYEELFKLWVPPENYAVIFGQSVKRYGDWFIVNYDIPAILHKNSRRTDFAVMICRSLLTRREFHELVTEMQHRLVTEGAIPADRPLARTFHYSAGPFEQIQDGIGYLFDAGINHLPLPSISFAAYLMAHGIGKEAIMRAIRHPILRFRTPEGDTFEENLLSYTIDETYPGALEKFNQRVH